MPRLSTAHQVSEVKVFGWDPDKKKEIVGGAKPQSSKLGDKHGSDVANGQAQERPAGAATSRRSRSKEEADNIAKSILNDRMMDFITGDGDLPRQPRPQAGHHRHRRRPRQAVRRQVLRDLGPPPLRPRRPGAAAIVPSSSSGATPNPHS